MSSIFSKRPAPHEVFTPRSHDVNQRTYAERPILERRLTSALRGDKYIIVYGESGNGKTWLYKKVLRQLGLPYQVINLANMHTDGSLNAVLLAKLGALGSSENTTTKTEIDGGIRLAGTGGGIKNISEYRNDSSSALARLAQEMGNTSGGKRTVLVLDNFEQIVDYDQFLREVASLIISADDEYIARHNIKILIVGTPTNIKQLISKVSNATTIANRFIEIPEVARLELGEARYIMSQGFEKHLQYTMLLDRNELYKDISWKTDRIAQHIQELCLKIAEYAEDNQHRINPKIVQQAEAEWADETLTSDRAVIEIVMNSQETKVGRKNQVLYCIGNMQKEDFRLGDVERAVRETFGVSADLNLNIPQILSSFVNIGTPLLRRMPKGGGYRFCSPKHKMAIRTMFRMTPERRVIKAG